MPSMTPLSQEQTTGLKIQSVVGLKQELSSRDQTQQIIDDIKCFIFDCDGVIWKGQKAVQGASATIQYLNLLGKKVFFVTNHPSDSRIQLKEKFDRLGFNVEAEQIYSSAYSATEYLKYIKFDRQNKKVLIIGAGGLVDEFQMAGFSTIGGPDHDQLMVDDNEVEVDPNVQAVVGGTDPYFNYYKCTYAQLCINQNKNCQFVSTNEDPAGHIIPTQIWPGAGAIVGAIKGCTGKEPVLVGKPSYFLIEMIRDKVIESGFEPNDTMMIGDRLDTDIDFGTKAGFKTTLVLSGCSTLSDLEDSLIKPNFIIESVANFLNTKKVIKSN